MRSCRMRAPVFLSVFLTTTFCGQHTVAGIAWSPASLLAPCAAKEGQSPPHDAQGEQLCSSLVFECHSRNTKETYAGFFFVPVPFTSPVGFWENELNEELSRWSNCMWHFYFFLESVIFNSSWYSRCMLRVLNCYSVRVWNNCMQVWNSVLLIFP